MRFSLTPSAILAFAACAAAQSDWWVSPAGSDANPGTQAQPFQTINHANTVAVAGDTVHLTAGVFGNEQGVVVLGSKDIAIIGAGPGVSILRVHSSATTNIPTGFPNAPVATQQAVGVLVQGASRVDLRDFTVDGDFRVPASGRLTGVYYRDGADGVVTGVEIINCRRQLLDGSQGVAGMIVRGDNLGDISKVTVRNCSVHDWGKAGVVAFFNTTMRVEDCRVVGMDHVQAGGPAQVGIQFAYDAGGSVHRSTIADIFYAPGSYVGTGILCYDAFGNVAIEDNGITNCEQAIYCFGQTHTTLAASIRRNRVVACDAGVFLDTISGASVVDNHLQMSLDPNADVAYDNAGGNTWSNNNYSSYSGIGTYAIQGTGGAVDATPRRGVDLFSPAATTIALPPGHFGRALAVAEFDGVAGSDFVSVDENAGLSITVGLNTGGAYSLSNLLFAPVGRVVAVTTAELNGAPGVDIAVLIQVTTPTAGAKVYTFANNGAGAFSLLGIHTLVGTLPSALAAGDVNGDGKADLAVANVGAFGSGDAILLTNQGPFYGTAFSQSVVPSFGYYSSAVRGVAIADVNGDGFKDVLVTEGNAAFGRLHVFLNNGFGGLAAAGYSPLFVSNDPTAVAAGDLDGDGDNDILVSFGTATNSTPGGVAVLENLNGAQFRRSTYDADFGASNIVFGNLDQDSDPDSVFADAAVLNADGGRISVLGSWVKGAGFGHGGFAVKGTTPTGIAFGNFDNDGFQDLFYTNGVGGQLVVLRGRPSARVDHYGFGTEGYRGRVPYLRPTGAPAVAVQPNATFGVEISNAREFTLSAIVCSLAPAPVLLPNSLQVDPTLMLFTNFGVTDGEGRFGMSFALAGAPSVRGLPLYFQGGVLDTIGNFTFYPGVAATDGMKLRIGY